MSDRISLTSSSNGRPTDGATTEQLDDLTSSGSKTGATAAANCEINASGWTSARRRVGRHGQPMHPSSGYLRLRSHWANPAQCRGKRPRNSSSSVQTSSPGATTACQSNNQQVLASSDTYEHVGEEERATNTQHSDDVVTPDSNVSADFKDNGSPAGSPSDKRGSDSSEESDEARIKTAGTSSPDQSPFADLDSATQTITVTGEKTSAEAPALKTELANVIEKAILDFCSSRTVETMRRMFAGVTSEMEAIQGEVAQSGKTVQAPHPVTGELVKEGIVIGSMDVFAPRVHREYCLLMRDSLVAGFLSDTGVFRAICYRTKCQLEVTRRLLNRKLCTGGCWIKYLIVRITGPSLRAITCCDHLLQKAVPAFKQRMEYPKAAYCRLFFREDIPDNSLLYNGFQRTGGTANRYGALRLETPYRITSERTVGTCPWKSGALKVGKLSFSGNGSHMCMQQVYPGYGYASTKPVEPSCKGIEAIERIEAMHNQFLTKRQQILHERRVMTIPVCR